MPPQALTDGPAPAAAPADTRTPAPAAAPARTGRRTATDTRPPAPPGPGEAGVGAAEDHGSVPPPRSATLVGREAEIEQLCDSLALGANHVPERHAVLLAGDAGVGKTRLLTELRDRAQVQGWRVVAGHCLDFADAALPYLPFTEVLDRLDQEAPEAVAAALEEHPALGRLQPGRRVAGSASEGAVEPRALLEAVHALLERAAADRPLLLVVEDLHWADRSTLDLLSFLFARPFDAPVAIVASYRSDDLHRRHPLRPQVAGWARLRHLDRLQLEPLPGADVRRLVRLLHPDPMPAAEVAAIVDRADGNAFFVEELVGAAGRALPEDLAGVLMVRVDRLDGPGREVVRAAAAAGRRVAHDLLAEATGLDQVALDQGLREAVDGNVLVPVRGDSYSFRHALLGEATYDDLLPGERVRLHTAYARALGSGRFRGAAAELARHARLAGDLDTALRAGVEAGDEALGVGGPDEAAQHYLQALTLEERGPAWVTSSWPCWSPGRARRCSPPATRSRRCGWCATSSTGCPPTPRPPIAACCSPPWRRRCWSSTATTTRWPGPRRPWPCSPTGRPGAAPARSPCRRASWRPTATPRPPARPGWRRSAWPRSSTCRAWSPTSAPPSPASTATGHRPR
ncbi:AAA family ATPase [Nocardioides sp.]|uniref:AAA family ATPase n=1 Tax=Nocardioides sp. TaxID=35761 RepID=UPI00352864CE